MLAPMFLKTPGRNLTSEDGSESTNSDSETSNSDSESSTCVVSRIQRLQPTLRKVRNWVKNIPGEKSERIKTQKHLTFELQV